MYVLPFQARNRDHSRIIAQYVQIYIYYICIIYKYMYVNTWIYIYVNWYVYNYIYMYMYMITQPSNKSGGFSIANSWRVLLSGWILCSALMNNGGVSCGGGTPIAGWLVYFHWKIPSEKYERQLGWLFPTEWKNKQYSKRPTRWFRGILGNHLEWQILRRVALC